MLMAYPIVKKTAESDNYPILLKEIPAFPKNIYFKGLLPEKKDTLIAIVGTRKVTLEGKNTAKQIARDLAKEGITVVSGLALGIDTAAHEGTLIQKGKTIAVLANGLDSVYPKTNENLAKEILENGGALISEYPENTPSYPNQFLERNRIISGLSIATVVIEAPIRSGALVTAKNALDQGREVFVVPGPARHPNYEGSHLLLRNGARLVTSAAQILDDLNIEKPMIENAQEKNYGLEASLIIEVLKKSKQELSLDNIAEITKLEPHVVTQKITLLMLDNLVVEKKGKFGLKK